jgi:flagellar hook-associated protein 1 FlgK
MSTFSGLNTALSALKAQRRGLDLTGQNIANANTVGYSRQRVELTAVGGATPAMYARPAVDDGGVRVSATTRIRDQYLEARGYTEHARQNLLSGRAEILSDVEMAFNEPSDTGLAARLNDLSAGFADVADNPEDAGSRNQLLVRAQIMATSLNSMATGFANRFESRRAELDNTATDVNTVASRLADLNDKVVRAINGGIEANELMDQRDLLVQQMVDLTGATVVRDPSGASNLELGGVALVTGATARALTVTGSTTLAGQGASPVVLRFADDGTAVAGVSGRTGALVEALNVTLPSYASAVDGVAANLISTVNAVHQGGFTSTGTPGAALFSGTTAGTIAVAITDPNAIAASSNPALALDGSNADKLANLGSAPGSAALKYAQVVARIGVEVNTSIQVATTQDTITEQVDLARTSVSGVNTDEELTAMLTYQRSYQAASKVMTTIDEMLDTLINRMGH